MPTKIRLQRHGKKKSSFYHIVIADGRAPRDGKFIEKIGTYNPNTNPATIDLQFDKALDWLQKGAQPTETAKAILSYEGVLYKNHLLVGVRKGALKEDEANKKFETWKNEKTSKIQAKIDNVSKSIEDENKKKLAAETELKEKRAKEILAKSSPVAEDAAVATAETNVVTEETAAPAAEVAEKAPAEATPATEAKTEAPAEEAPAPEAKAEAPAEATPAPEAKDEAPAEETPAAEAPAEEAPKAEASEETAKDEAGQDSEKEKTE